MLNTEVFLNFLLSVKQITNANTVSLLISDNNNQSSEEILFHEGSTPLSEFSTTKKALKSIDQINNQTHNHSSNSELITVLKNEHKNSLIIRINFEIYQQYLVKNKNSLNANDRRDKKVSGHSIKREGILLLGFNFAHSALPEFINILRSNPTPHKTDIPEAATDWFVHMLCQGGAIVWQAFQFSTLFQDPTSCLPGRMAFQVYLKKIISEATHSKTDVGLIFINPDEFVTINQRLGWRQGDLTLTEIAEKLQFFLRRNDLVFRYGGAIFALILPRSTLSEINLIAEKILNGLSGDYANISSSLTFSIGAAIYQSDNEGELQDCVDNLITQTDQALNIARLSGENKPVIWNKSNTDCSLLHIDQLGSILNSESEKDYRNMLLLWDTITVISNAYDAQKIAIEFIERIKQTLKPFRIGLFEQKEASLHSLATLCGQKNENQQWLLSNTQRTLLKSSQQEKKMERTHFTDRIIPNEQEVGFVAYAFPLLVRSEPIGYLYLDGPEHSFTMGSSDLVLLNALTCQLAIALDRAALEFSVKKEKEKESRKLKQEVQELRKVIHSAKLIYRSSQMQSLLETLSTVAPTDITILINGESGTGKEMLARAIHEQSPRKNNALITVDCGAIAISLMESELFGYVKGAYTGAQGSSPGRILQAKGGTLFLDEIGELPLDVQAKLLRFVQEKEITPVGGGKTQKVDVRIIAATNRDLAEEVTAGRFRGDLYYRLQVITLLAPPLRERPDDIIPLAQHFLEKFSVQYEKGILHLNDEAKQALLKYRWPGNIRELQNTIMRAVVISKKDSIDAITLNLKPSALTHPKENIPINLVDTQLPPTPLHSGGIVIPVQKMIKIAEKKTSATILMQLRKTITSKLQLILQADIIITVPLGRWLTEDLVLEANRVDRGIARRASLRLGIPETTFRRQLVKVKQAEQAGVLSRTADWANIKPFLAELVTHAEEVASKSLLEQVRTMLLQEIFIQIPDNKTLAAALMGITLPTYQRWLDKVNR